jgi:rare lipoprotein A
MASSTPFCPSLRSLTALTVCAATWLAGCAPVPIRVESSPISAPVVNAPGSSSTVEASPASSPGSAKAPKAKQPEKGVDRSGSTQVGKASFYADKFAGRKMADGARMDPHDDNAASKSLPLGTTAKVVNVETGRSAVVTIQDRGPYVKGRIVDLSPATAQQIGISKETGMAKVEVTPLSIPPADAGKPADPTGR